MGEIQSNRLLYLFSAANKVEAGGNQDREDQGVVIEHRPK